MYSVKQAQELVENARSTIKYFIATKQVRKSFTIDTALKEKRGVFVTLKTADGKLRGCVGYTQTNRSLIDAVAQASINAAFGDKRFTSVQGDELDELLITLSVFSNPKELEGNHETFPEKITPGMHGLLLEKGSFRAVLLPNEAVQGHYSSEAMLEQVCLRAKLLKTSWKDTSTTLSVFTTQEFEESAPKGTVLEIEATPVKTKTFSAS